MRLGARPDPAVDRGRRLLRGAGGWFGRHRALVATAVLLVMVAGTVLAGLVVIVDEDPTVSNQPERVVALALHRVGLNPEDVLLVAAGLKYVNVGIPGNYVRGMLASPERIEIEIAELDVQRLAYERDVALRQGYWIPSDEDYVPLTIRHADQTLHGKARLKGDNADHYYGEKWSLRVELDGDDRLMRMGEFGLQAPRTRNYMAEWLYQQALDREGIPGIAYRFVDVTINGKHMGTYGLEQEFDEGIMWYNRDPPGPIVRFSKAEYHRSFVSGRRMLDPERTVVLDVVGGNATPTGYSENETAAALRLLEQWRRGEIPTSDAFDLRTTARYFALSDLFGNVHGDLLHNIRFYYNPVTGRLEPVGYDANAGVVIEEIKGLSESPYYRLFFDDPVLTRQYLSELDRVSSPGYLEALFAGTETAFRANASVIYRDQPYYHFSRKPYLANRATIRNTLHPFRAVSAYLNGSAPSGLTVDLGASQQLPVEVTGARSGGLHGVPEGGPVLLPGKPLYGPVQFQTVAFAFPDGGWNASAPVEVECRVLGTSESRFEGVAPAPRLSGAAAMGALARLPANTGTLDFAVTDDADRTVFLLPGSHRVDEPLVVPEGYALLCGPGTRLDLVRNASIVARGPLAWEGTDEHPIVVGSSDGTGGGVLVLRAPNASTLVNVQFDSLATPGVAPESGSTLTFFESAAVLDRVTMRGDGGAPLLRLIGGSFLVTGSVFAGGAAPAVSAEYASGNLTDTLVADGAGLRVLGSLVELDDCRFARIAGPAVRAVRESTLSGRNVACVAAETGLAVESGSQASLESLLVRDAGTGVCVGDTADGCGPGRAALVLPTLSNVTVPYAQQGGGIVTVDGGRVRS